jgi:anaerobic selenocysteine-containing dehydrogenase
MDGSFIQGSEFDDPNVRSMDQSKIGRVLTGDKASLYDGPPVTAMLVQNTNPVSVAPEQELVKQGFAREDLFVAVHEQFMTETAELADIVLPATMFVEHDDIYRGGGHQHIILGPKLIEGPATCRTNLFVVEELAKRLGVKVKTLRGWENDLAEPRANRLQMLAGLLNVSIVWLLTGEGDGVDAPVEAADPNSDSRNLLLEIRQLRTEASSLADRLGHVEKRLRVLVTTPKVDQ